MLDRPSRCAILPGVTRPGPAQRGRRSGPAAARDRRPAETIPAYVTREPAAGARRGAPARGSRGGHRAAPGDRFAPPYRMVELRTPDGPLRARVDPERPARRARPPASPLRRFVRAWGWRAYVLPMLTALTVLCGIDVANGAESGIPLLGSTPGSAPPAAAAPSATAGATSPAAPARPRPTSTGIFVDDGGSGTARPLPPTALPAGAAYTARGTGRFAAVPGTSQVYGEGPLHRFSVELEGGVADNGPAFAAAVEKTLSDPRSWGNGGRASFQRVDSGPVDFRVSLTASLTVRKLCGYELPYETSCYNGEQARVVINDARWTRGAVSYAGKVPAYRLYVINHEVGHALGNAHVQCPAKGALAPIMMQQTLGISTPGVGACKPNAWPFP